MNIKPDVRKGLVAAVVDDYIPSDLDPNQFPFAVVDEVGEVHGVRPVPNVNLESMSRKENDEHH